MKCKTCGTTAGLVWDVETDRHICGLCLLVENERLRAGYLWLEKLAESGRGVIVTVDTADGALRVAQKHDCGSVYDHIDLADLCMEEAAEAAKGGDA